MSPTAQIIFAVIATNLAATTLLITVIGFMWKSTDQRFKGIDQRFTDLEKVFDARLETIRVEIHQLQEQAARPPLVRP